ncbi:MAG: hypothetical protein JNJ85_06880 [Candidatus Kapabacteria bacterium]|nr:hypothetical protein [Candidatus Kapabacteria bacterium]
MNKDEFIDDYTNAGLMVVLFEKIVEKSKLSYDTMTWFEKIDVMIVVDMLMKEKVVVRMWNDVHTLITNRFENQDTFVKTMDKITMEFDKGIEFLWEEEKVNTIMMRLMTTPR